MYDSILRMVVEMKGYFCSTGKKRLLKKAGLKIQSIISRLIMLGSCKTVEVLETPLCETVNVL